MLFRFAAVVDRGGRKTVFVITEDGQRVQQVDVRLGLSEGDFVEVLEGPGLAQRVVTLGSHLVRDGQDVEVVGEPAATSD